MLSKRVLRKTCLKWPRACSSRVLDECWRGTYDLQAKASESISPVLHDLSVRPGSQQPALRPFCALLRG